VTSTLPAVHAFAAHDSHLRMYNLVLWNFSSSPLKIDLQLAGLSTEMRTRHIVLDATSPSADENSRLRPDPFKKLPAGNQNIALDLDPYAIHYWSFE
jgi:hypothetical protein